LTILQGAVDHVNCGKCDFVDDLMFSEEGSCATDTTVSTWNFKNYWKSSVVSGFHHPWSYQSHPLRRNNVLIRLLIYSGVVKQR